MWVKFINTAAATVTFNVRWNGANGVQNSNPTSALMAGQDQSLDMSNYSIPDGTSCWAYGHALAGEGHESGDNFTFTSGGGVATYQCSGTTGNLSFSLT